MVLLDSNGDNRPKHKGHIMTITLRDNLTLSGSTTTVLQHLVKLSILDQGLNIDTEAMDVLVGMGARLAKGLDDDNYMYSINAKDDLVAMVDDNHTMTISKHYQDNYFIIATKCDNYDDTLSYLNYVKAI